MTHEKKMLDREAVRSVIQQWNTNRLDLFELSEPDENLLFHGVMRFYFQDAEQKYATKCIRVASDATVSDVIDTLVEKFRPDMRMLSVPNYALYEVYANGEERRLNPDEKPLLVQLNWHIDDREGRFFLKNIDQKAFDQHDPNFKRKLSKREKKEQKKKDKLAKLTSDPNTNNQDPALAKIDSNVQVAGKLYSELPETSFTRSISNPEAVMRRRRQQKLEKKLQQFRSRDGGPDTGGTLKIYGESLCRDVPYKTLLLSIRDCAQAVVREMLSKYGLEKCDPLQYCLVQVNSDGTEYVLDDDECPLSILMNHPTSRGSIMFHVRRRPADSQPRRRKKKPLGVSNGTNNLSNDREGPALVEVTHSGDGGRRIKLGNDPIEVGSANTNCLQLFGPSIQPRHCLISLMEGVCTVTPLHTDALTFVNGHHITQPTILHNGSVVMFGRVASYRFVDSPTDGRYNLALSQSQLDSAYLYESRSPITSDSWNDDHGVLNSNYKTEYQQNADKTNKYNASDEKNKQPSNDQQFGHISKSDIPTVDSQNNEGNLENETKSVSSSKSNGSNVPERPHKALEATNSENQGQEPILPAVLEFPETYQEDFLKQIISHLDVNAPHFKLAPVYTLYLCARYRASTHYRPELQPTERAHKLTIFLHHVANLIYSVVQEQYNDSRILAFWMANSSEFLHFLKSDRHISAFSVQAQEVLAESVQTAFRNLVNCFRVELSQTLNQFLSETIDHDSAAGLVLTVLGSAMALLRRCRVNAALTIQLFSQLFHYINVICFNTIVSNTHMCTAEWGKVMNERLQLLEIWAERQGLELAADCHLAKINQCAQFLQARKTNVEEVQQLVCSCFRLNSLQTAALLQNEQIPRNLVDTAIRMAESVADELTRADGREILLEESPELHLALLLPDDGFSCDVVRRIPSGLVDFLNPLQQQGMCRLAAQPTSIGLWTVYMHQFNVRSSSSMSNKLPQPEIQIIKLHKNSNGMGLSIVAAKGAGQERLGIYIKSVVPGGAADADGRLQAGDQLLRVDGQSLIGITQERAADYLVRTGPVVTLEVAKQGAIYHGLATLLQQPSPVTQRGGNRRMSERDLSRLGGEFKNVGPLVHSTQLPNSKSVPALHHHTGSGTLSTINSKSRSTHSLIPNASGTISGNNEQGFYQNLSIYRTQHQNQTVFAERPSLPSYPPMITGGGHGSYTNSPPVGTQSVHITSDMNAHQHRAPMNSYQKNAVAPQNNSYHQQQIMNTHQNSESEVQQSSTLLQFQQHSSHAFTDSGLKNITHLNRENPNGNKLRNQQGMTPSMPNISSMYPYTDPSQAPNNLLSQSMQNVNVMEEMKQNYGSGLSEQDGIERINTQYSYVEHTQTGHIPRRPLRNDNTNQKAGDVVQQLYNQSADGTLDKQLQSNNPMQQTQYSNAANKESTENHGISPKPQHLPQGFRATTPKPQQQSKNINDIQAFPEKLANQRVVDEKPPLPPTATHPLFKASQQIVPGMNYVASTLEPPKGGYKPVSNIPPGPNQKNFMGTNPWEREEREREVEIRREHIRLWREQQISELYSIPERTSQQEEQLKTLILERDFERRALEAEEQEEESELSYEKENMQEIVRLSNPTNAMQTPITSFRQTEIKIATSSDNANNDVQQNSNTDITNSPLTAKYGTDTSDVDGWQQQALIPSQLSQVGQQMPAPTLVHLNHLQPKSILKNNRYDASNNTPSSPSKSQKSTSFADEYSLQADQAIGGVSKDLSQISLSSLSAGYSVSVPESVPPPPPPERNSSYAVMAQQKVRNSAIGLLKPQIPLDNITQNSVKKSGIIPVNNNSSNYPTGPNTSQTQTLVAPDSSTTNANSLLRENKRVSFHDTENNYVVGTHTISGYMAENYSGDVQLQQNVDTIPEDRSVSQENVDISMLPSMPSTPDAALWNTTIQSTPGVIGAQEVYRDPRQRRLAEKQQQQRNAEAVPEKLSFKEKMKMFGEDHTPKDKLKISRAQRDIDAVH